MRAGLFQVVVGGKVSDVLGLADVVFPAMLAGWSIRYDVDKRTLYERARDDSLRVIEDNSVTESDETVADKVEVKLGIVGRVKMIFRRLRKEETNDRETAKVREREQNIIVILEEEKIEVISSKLDVDSKNSLFSSSILGYGIGCVLCEIFQTGEGQPALLYIVPSMFTSVFTTGVLRGELKDMWEYRSNNEEKLS